MTPFTRAALVATAALWAGAAAAPAADLRLAHWLPPTHPIHPTGYLPWAESIAEDSDGRISITVFPAQQLGAAPDHYDMARDGIADISFVNPGYTAGRFPIVALTEIPFHVSSAFGGAAAVHEWYARYAPEEMPEVVLCLASPHDPGTLHSTRPVHVPADVSGLNVRPAHATMARFVNMLGGAAVQVPAPETREAISKGVADAITFPWNSVFLFGIDQTTKEHLDMPFYISTQFTLISKASYDALSPEDRAVVDAHCTPEWSEEVTKGWNEWEAAGRDKMIEAGHTLYAPSDEEVALWREAAAPLIAEWKAAVTEAGYDADAIYADYIATLKKHGVYYGAE